MKQKSPSTPSSNLFPVVGIGASAGGLDAFKKLLKAIPENSGMAYVLVQHLDPTHESMLPELLHKVTNIPVSEVTDNIKVQPNHIYVIPSNSIMVSNDGVLELSCRPAKSKLTRHLPIDIFFTSLAEVHESHSIGVVLSGTGSDGTQGLKAIKAHGGITFVQDGASAAYEGMPQSAVLAGVVDFILSPEQIPQKLLEVTRIIDGNGSEEKNTTLQDTDAFKQILSLLRVRKGTDFTYYKQTTIQRRILRRMALSKNESPANYLKFLRENKSEQDILYQDLLIPVTEFFRDAKTFEHLRETVLPKLLKSKTNGDPIRIWVAGCSTGEEAFSIAMSLKESLEDGNEKVQIFATDISEPAIAKARAGIYKKSEVESLSTKRLNDFFVKNNGNYQVKKEIRDTCVFAVHNFLKDPPFGKMDLISCRNVLIYMEPYLQKKVLTTFHYALNNNSFLLLGKSESISSVPELFAPSAKSEKIFLRKDLPAKMMQAATQRSEKHMQELNENARPETLRTDFQKAADDVMTHLYMPAGVVVNEAMDIVQFRGKTNHFLEQSARKPSHNLLKLAKQGMAFELRNILHKVKKEKTSATKENISLESGGKQRVISIEAFPLETVVPHYLILFRESVIPKPTVSDNNEAKGLKSDKLGLRIGELEKELAQTHEDMRSITEDQEAANEELQSANEELLSSSEELQTLNEELETSKEELQSTNEELMVVNQELHSSNEQLTDARDYAEAIISNLRQPLLVLDKGLRVKNANDAFYKTFQVNEAETEDILIYDLGNGQWNIPALRTALEKVLPEKSRFQDFECTLAFETIGKRTMLLNGRELERYGEHDKLILLAIEDVTEKTKARHKTEESEKKYKDLIHGSPVGIYTCDMEGNIELYNDAAIKMWGRTPEAGKDKWCGSWKMYNADGMPLPQDECPMAITVKKGQFVSHEIIIERPDGTRSWVIPSPQPEYDLTGKLRGAINTVIDITELKNAEALLEQSHKIQTRFLEVAVEKRTEELNKSNKAGEAKNIELELKNMELENMNKELQSFNYISSHDLQEPLRQIQTFSNLIAKKDGETLSDKSKEYFQKIKNAAERMQNLIHDLLAFSRVSQGEKQFENIDLNSIVADVIKEYKEVIDKKQAVIQVGELCEARVISFQFHQLMQNLIGNALKFSDPDVTPYLEITSENKIYSKLNDEELLPGREYCHITISDNGIGFDPEYKDRIFQLFQRLHGKETYTGTGIGLAIVKKVVDNHNGIIRATGELGKGARFDIYIPV